MDLAPRTDRPEDSPHGIEVAVEGAGVTVFAGHACFVFRRLRERGHQLYAEVYAWDDYGKHEIDLGSVDLLSLRARDEVTRRLDGTILPEGRGQRLVSDIFGEVIAKHRDGEQVEVLDGDRPPQTLPHAVAPVIPDLAPTLIYGMGGSFKSTLLVAMMVSVASGREVIPGWKPQQRPVLYLDWESSAATVAARRIAISRGAGIEPPPLHYKRMRRSLTDQLDEITEAVEERAIGFIGIDSVGMALGAGAEGGDANESALRLFAALRQLGLTSVLLDHITGDDLRSEAAVPKAYGSVYKMNHSRAAFELRAQADPTPPRTELLLRQAKPEEMRPRLQPIGLAVVHEVDIIRFETCEVSAPDLVKLGRVSNADRFEALLRGGALTVPEIAEELGLKTDIVRSKLHRLKGKRFVQLDGGRWGLTQHE